MEKLQSKGRKILKKILGQVKENYKYKRQHIKLEKVTDTIRKKRIIFYSNTAYMSTESLTDKIFVYFLSKKSQEPSSSRQKGTCMNWESFMEITINNRLTKKLGVHRFPGKVKLRTGFTFEEKKCTKKECWNTWQKLKP